jgi:hypothetical protein
MPLVWELTKELLTWLTPDKLRSFQKSWASQGNEFSIEVIEDLAGLVIRRDMHYESILGYLEAQSKRAFPAERQQEYHGVYSWLVEMVYHILYFRHVNNVVTIEARAGLLDGMARLATVNAPLWIFSLNHDVMVECLAARHGIELNCGMSDEEVTLPRRDERGEKIGELRAQVLRKESLEKVALPFLQHGKTGINLMKLHGALDVFTFNNGEDLLKLLPVERTVSGVIETLRAVNNELFYPERSAPNGRIKATNEIFYLDDEGEGQFLRRSLLAGAHKFDAHRDQVLPKLLLAAFHQQINAVARLICIGYGFGDIHVNQVLRDWLAFSGERRLEIVGPGVCAVPPFLQHLTTQVVLVDARASDYLDRATGIVRTDLELAQKRFDAWARGRSRNDVTRRMKDFLARYHGHLTQGVVQRMASLPVRSGDIDLGAIGAPTETIARRILAESGGTTPTMLNAFVDEQERATGPSHSEIAEAAYQRWVTRGGGDGLEREDWLVAEAQLKKGPE